MVELNEYNSDGSLYWKIVSKYDDKDNNTEQNWYNSDGSLFKKFSLKYDSKGNI